MDPARKKELKKLGKRLEEERSAKIRAKLDEENPAPVGSDEWIKNYRNEILKKKEIRLNLPNLIPIEIIDSFFELHFPKQTEGKESDEKFNAYKQLFHDVLGETALFKRFFMAMCEDDYFQIGDMVSVALPRFIIEENEYEGQVEVFYDFYNDEEYLEKVELESFITLLKKSALLYRDHVEKEFDPVPHFFKLDRIVEKYDETTYSEVIE